MVEKKNKNFSEDLELLTLKDLSALFQVSYGTIKKMRYKQGFPPAIRIGCQWRWWKKDIKKYLDSLKSK